MLHREEPAQAEAERPRKTCVLRKGATIPLGTEGSIRGQTEEGCLSCRCLAAMGRVFASESQAH